MPQKGEFIFKVLFVFYVIIFCYKKETMNTYLVHSLSVGLRWLSVHVLK